MIAVVDLEPIALHECRHTAASEMRAAGLDFKMIQSIIGHSSVTTTFDRYTHVSRDHLRAAAEQFERHLDTFGPQCGRGRGPSARPPHGGARG